MVALQLQLGVQPDFVMTQMLARVRMSEWEETGEVALLAEVMPQYRDRTSQPAVPLLAHSRI